MKFQLLDSNYIMGQGLEFGTRFIIVKQKTVFGNKVQNSG